MDILEILTNYTRKGQGMDLMLDRKGGEVISYNVEAITVDGTVH